jgi:hypothetical protein
VHLPESVSDSESSSDTVALTHQSHFSAR